MYSAIRGPEVMRLIGTFVSTPDTHAAGVGKELTRKCLFGNTLGYKQGSTPAASIGEYRGSACGLVQIFPPIRTARVPTYCPASNSIVHEA